MSESSSARTRLLTVVAQDPSVQSIGGVLTTRVAVPAETLAPGPRGYRVHVVDYDGATDTHYSPRTGDLEGDPWAGTRDPAVLRGDPHFHAQNVYAIAMSTLGVFEAALGRHVHWAFASGAHQIKIAPHAFAEANAFYSRRDEGLLFGYFPDERGEPVFTCLSHDVVVHETTHAILDGLRGQFMRPSSIDQVAFHEGFADIVALLSVFRHQEVVDYALGRQLKGDALGIELAATELEALKKTILTGLAEGMGRALPTVRGSALRRSVELDPEHVDLDEARALHTPHRLGEVLVAAVMRALLAVWDRRLQPLRERSDGTLDRARVAEEGASAAARLLTIAIRAIDYTPPLHMTFEDYLSALLTADAQLFPGGGRYDYPRILEQAFAAYGIRPASRGRDGSGVWAAPEEEVRYDRSHFEPMQSDPDEVFRFVWENRAALHLSEQAFTRIESVRPLRRIGEGGFILRETIVEYYQLLDLRAGELGRLDIEPPDGLEPRQRVRLIGGGTLIFDEYGRLAFHVGAGVTSRRQTDRLASLQRQGALRPSFERSRRFARLHRMRDSGRARFGQEQW